MPKLSIAANSTSQTVDIFIQDATATDGSGKTGLVYNTSGLTAYYNWPRGTSIAVTLATLSAPNVAWSSGGFKEIDSTNQKGHYRFDIPNNLLASGQGRSVKIVFQCTGCVPCPLEIELTGWDNQDSAAGGMSDLSYTYNKMLDVGFDGSNNIHATLANESTTIPSGYAATVPGRLNQIYNRFFGKTIKDRTGLTIKTYDPIVTTTVLTTQSYTDDNLGGQTITEAS